MGQHEASPFQQHRYAVSPLNVTAPTHLAATVPRGKDLGDHTRRVTRLESRGVRGHGHECRRETFDEQQRDHEAEPGEDKDLPRLDGVREAAVEVGRDGRPACRGGEDDTLGGTSVIRCGFTECHSEPVPLTPNERKSPA